MSLKGVNTVSREAWAKYVQAANDYKNGKRNAEQELYKCVEQGTISKEVYDAVIEQYADSNRINKENQTRLEEQRKSKSRKIKNVKEKRELYIGRHPLKAYMPILFFFSIIAAIGIVLSAVENPTFWVAVAVGYLLIVFWLYYFSNNQDIQQKDREIAELKEEVRKLEDIRKSDKHIIELLEKELEKVHNSLQQNQHEPL